MDEKDERVVGGGSGGGTETAEGTPEGWSLEEGHQKEVTPKSEELRRQLAEDRQRRQQLCIRDIQNTLKRHQCAIIGRPAFSADGRVAVEINVEAQ